MLYSKCKEVLIRKKTVAIPLEVTFTKLNQIIRGWINYYRIGSIKGFLDEFGQWYRHKVRMVIINQWKKPKTIFRNLMQLDSSCIEIIEPTRLGRPFVLLPQFNAVTSTVTQRRIRDPYIRCNGRCEGFRPPSALFTHKPGQQLLCRLRNGHIRGNAGRGA